MIPQIQPNRWSCVPTALAMLLEETVETVIAGIGHDGSEIIHPELEEPYCRRGFHFSEIVDYAYDRALSITEIEAIPFHVSSHKDATSVFVPIFSLERCKERLFGYLEHEAGILTGKLNGHHHAVAWNGKINDPCGFIYPVQKMEIWSFYLIRDLTGEIERAEQTALREFRLANHDYKTLQIGTGYLDVESNTVVV